MTKRFSTLFKERIMTFSKQETDIWHNFETRALSKYVSQCLFKSKLQERFHIMFLSCVMWGCKLLNRRHFSQRLIRIDPLIQRVTYMLKWVQGRRTRRRRVGRWNIPAAAVKLIHLSHDNTSLHAGLVPSNMFSHPEFSVLNPWLIERLVLMTGDIMTVRALRLWDLSSGSQCIESI